jgi:pimeloyl-ACP methyl ester carboxylesterase
MVSTDPASSRPEVEQAYRRALSGTSVTSRMVSTPTGQVHLLETGEGPPLVLLHSTGNAAGFFLPLLRELRGVRAIAPDLPGIGLSHPVKIPWQSYRTETVAWLDRLFDVLELDTVSLLGHSGGGVWALWYALARPHRVRRLVQIGVPTLPWTRCPLPIRMISTPGLGSLLSRLAPPSRESVLKIAEFVGEKETLLRYPEVVDLLGAVAADPIAGRATTNEFRALISPFALLTRSGFRRRGRVHADDLRGLAMPTLVLWGDRDPVGSAQVAQAIADLIPHGRALVLPAGHGPFLGHPAQVADNLVSFTSSTDESTATTG